MSKSDKRILDIILNYEVVGYIFSNAKVLYLVYKDFFYCRIIIQKKVFDFDVRLSLLLLLIKLVLVHLLAISCIISKKLLYGNFFLKKKGFSPYIMYAFMHYQFKILEKKQHQKVIIPFVMLIFSFFKKSIYFPQYVCINHEILTGKIVL